MVGTRPEAIKMAPVFFALKKKAGLSITTISSGQHTNLIESVFNELDWQPDIRCNLERSNAEISPLYSGLFTSLQSPIEQSMADYVLVHGDTATTMVASVITHLNRIRLGHVEAGLRSHNKLEPWPEESNRRITDVLADDFFAPTQLARKNLISEGIHEKNIVVTGNTAIDTVCQMRDRLEKDDAFRRSVESHFEYLKKDKPLVVVTGHRRENFGDNISSVFRTLIRLHNQLNCQVVFPLHPNHELHSEINLARQHCKDFFIIEPVTYGQFCYLMFRCSFLISDSGGVQEEAPSFGKQVLVTRNVTERPEGVDAGFLHIVGADETKIIDASNKILKHPNHLKYVDNPYGDGNSSQRIAKKVAELIGKSREN